MDVTMIPFALRSSDRAFVDVSEVPRGRAAGCICPSCGAPLIARRGEVQVWHFAHATRSTYARTLDRCEYSFFVSVRMMARQVIGPAIAIAIALPGMEGTVSVDVPGRRSLQRVYTVTHPRSVDLVDAKIEVAFGDVIVDVLGQVGDVPLALYFIHPGRPVPPTLMATAQTTGRCGVVLIDLSPLHEHFLARDAGRASSFLASLRKFLSDDVAHKRWLYHPRDKQARMRAEVALKADMDRQVPPAAVQPAARVAGGANINYECVLCAVRWTGSIFERTCPRCQSHLCTREVGDSDSSAERLS
jgi:hypothetical protein